MSSLSAIQASATRGLPRGIVIARAVLILRALLMAAFGSHLSPALQVALMAGAVSALVASAN
jgi:hypothetical protein